MANLYQYTALWQGFTGSPGYTRFYYANRDTQTLIDSAGAAMRTFFNSLAAYLGTGWTVQVQPSVPFFDEITGRLQGEVTQSAAPAVVTGTSSTAIWAAGTGAMMRWNTNVIWNGHRVKGRSFLVPLRGQLDVDGTLLGAFVTTANSAASALITAGAGDFVIWAKQYSAPPGATQINGTHGSVTTGTIRDLTAVLRSRRD